MGLEISSEKVVQVVYLAREGASALAELEHFITNMNDDEKAHLVAIAWVGRGVYTAAEYAAAVSMARAEATTPTATYLSGMPHLAENLEAGLDAMGVDVSDAEEDFL